MSDSNHLPGTLGPLWTDAYKFTMAAAGYPARPEVAVLYTRKGTERNFNFAFLAEIVALILRVPTQEEKATVQALTGVTLADDVWELLSPRLVTLVPHGRHAIVRAPSFTWSILEPVLLGMGTWLGAASLGARWTRYTPDMQHHGVRNLTWDPADADALYTHAHERAEGLVALAESEGLPVENLAEGGLRSAPSPGYHREVLRACKAAGITATSNVALAAEKGMRAVGTTGHEHVMRYGSDLEAFYAQTDRLPGPSTFLLDTFDTIHSGLPSALRVLKDFPGRSFGLRPDYEPTQQRDIPFIMSTLLHEKLEERVHLDLSGSMDFARTQHYINVAKTLGFPLKQLRFLYGDYLNAPPDPQGARMYRGAFSTVMKLVYSRHYCQKHGPGKETPFHLIVESAANDDSAKREIEAQRQRSIRLACGLEPA